MVQEQKSSLYYASKFSAYLSVPNFKEYEKNYKTIYSSTEKTWEEYYLQMRSEEFVEDTKFIWGK